MFLLPGVSQSCKICREEPYKPVEGHIRVGAGLRQAHPERSLKSIMIYGNINSLQFKGNGFRCTIFGCSRRDLPPIRNDFES